MELKPSHKKCDGFLFVLPIICFKATDYRTLIVQND